MYNSMLFMSLFSNTPYGLDSEYYNLSEEEKFHMDFFNECLYDSNERFQDACTRIMLLLMEMTARINSTDEMSEEEIQQRKEMILHDFTDKEKEKLEHFIYSCIQCMGIYSEERVQERKLKKKGNDNLCQK